MKKLSIENVAEWTRLRKDSVIAHWLYGGVICAVASYIFFPAGLALLCLFGGFEYWNDKNHNTHEGDLDWWDAFVAYCIGLVVLFIFQLCNVITIRWWA